MICMYVCMYVCMYECIKKKHALCQWVNSIHYDILEASVNKVNINMCIVKYMSKWHDTVKDCSYKVVQIWPGLICM